MLNRRGQARVNPSLDFGKMKIGTKVLDDAVLNLGALKKVHRNFGDKNFVLAALMRKDVKTLREISDFFYDTNGIYHRVCDYLANMYRYDWYTVPEIFDEDVKEEKVLKDFSRILTFLDNSHLKEKLGEIALEVVTRGAYYGYIVPCGDRLILQQLPTNYCRSNFFVGDNPVVEFNMRFFDENFADINYRMRVLKMFPPEFQKGYILYKQGKLARDESFVTGLYGSWYTLDPQSAVKFSMTRGDIPVFVSAIPSILDLDAGQDLDRRKQMQQLLKIVIQQLPLDKNGDLIFDVEEAKDIHNNAVEMLKRAIGVDVLTTFADITVEDLADDNSTTSTDDLERLERTVFNDLGISKNIFNTDGNLSLQYSIMEDESSIKKLLLKFQCFLDRVTQSITTNNKRKYNFRFYMLETTQYNYKEIAKLYKEHVAMGYSKMLPQIALGHSQSSILHTIYFENNVLHLSELMIPPLTSASMNADALTALKGGEQGEGAGRPEKPDTEKSEKTLQNIESMS